MAKLIEIEGTDGAGKSTALKYIIETLRAAGKRVLETREVGNPHLSICMKLRELVLDPASNLSGEAMEFVFAAMRLENQRFYLKVKPDYDFIISDRGWLSHLAYTPHNTNEDFTKKFYHNLVSNLTSLPDSVVYMSVNTETALKRRVKRGETMDAIEMKGIEFQEKVRQSFETELTKLSVSNSNMRVFKVDANQSLDHVKTQLDQVVKELL